MYVEIWTYRETSGLDPTAGVDISGYGVEAQDGSIGKIDEATYEIGSSYVVVDTGPWILGKKVMIPAGLIERVDPDEEKVWVAATKDEIKSAPELDGRLDDAAYRDELGSYYAGRGYTPEESRRGLSV
jgi:hypothetical protein